MLVAGNSVKLLRNGAEAFPAWIAAIDNAKRRVSLEMYIFSDDGIGRQFSEALARAAQRGVEVRLLYDFVGCRETPATFFQKMRGFGVGVVGYHKYRFWRPRLWSLIRRNHRKTLVYDGGLAFTGGNQHLERVGQQGRGGRRLARRGRGGRGAGGGLKSRRRSCGPGTGARPSGCASIPTGWRFRQSAGAVALAVVSDSELRDRFVIRRAALHAIRQSQQRILLANPYFVPNQGVLRALQSAARRGVDVRLLVPLASDSRLLDFATRAIFPQLLAAAARISA